MLVMQTKSRYVKDDTGQWWFLLKNGARTRVSEQTCAQCGKTFVAYRARVTCSYTCAGLRKRVPPKPLVECSGCGTKFAPIVGRQKYCSHSCAATTMHKHRAQTTTVEDRGLVNEDNPRFSQDEQGQWWYQSKTDGRTRARVIECAFCRRRALQSIFHRSRYCSPRCGNLNAIDEGRKGPQNGEHAPRWLGGRIQRNGYVLVYQPEHPTVVGSARIYVAEHRLVMEKMIGRYLKPQETVHHKNGIRDDNRPENLELWAKSHPPGQRVSDIEHD